MLDDWFVQDHYFSSVRDMHSEDNRYITFQLQQFNRDVKMGFERRCLFWYKMSEISRVVMSTQMLSPQLSSYENPVSKLLKVHKRGQNEQLRMFNIMLLCMLINLQKEVLYTHLILQL